MEANNKTLLLFILAVLQICTGIDHPDNNLTCYNDYINKISCEWNNTNQSIHTDTVCTLLAKRVNTSTKRAYNASCNLEPTNVSIPVLKKCTLDFKKIGIFQSFHKLNISLRCNPSKTILTISYYPSKHIKLNPPRKPDINFTTVIWSPQVKQHERISVYMTELQWKKWDQSWSDPSVLTQQTKHINCKNHCEGQLDSDLLKQGERHEARVRVKVDAVGLKSVWSDWSPTASWVSPVMTTASPPPSPQLSDFAGSISGTIVACAALALFLVGIFFRNDKATWVYEKIRGPPPPDPGKSFLKNINFQNGLSPHFTSASFHSSLKLEDIVYVEVVSSVDAVTLCGKEAGLLEKMRSESNYEPTSSCFSNPSYSKSFPPSPDSLPCTNNTPGSHGSVGGQYEGKSAEKVREEGRMKEQEILLLLSKGNSSEPVQVISDYEKVDRLQVMHFRLQSLDSGVCSGEEVSQESLEADSISTTDGHEEGPENKESEKEGRSKNEVDFQKLFGVSGNFFDKGSIQVCSDYEQVQKLQPGSPEFQRLDSGISSGRKGQVSHCDSSDEVNKSTDSTNLLFPPPLSCALPFPSPSLPQQPLKVSGAGLSPALRPPSPSNIVGKIALMSMSRSIEPSGDGYMPVRQEPGEK